MASLLEDVAKEAKVSIGTASRVINGKGGDIRISKATQERVMKIANDLNYQPNFFAASLRNKKSNMLGITLSYLVDPYCATIVHGIDQAASARGYRLVLSVIHDKPEPMSTCREMFGKRSVDGVLIVGSSLKLDDQSVMQLSKEGMRIALVDRQIKNSSLPFVLVDNVKGGFLATEHLIKLGHKRIGFIGVPRGVSKGFCHKRLEGAVSALETHGLEFDESLSPKVSLVTVTPFNVSRVGYEIMREILERGQMPSAIFAFSDVLAFGAIVAIRERGLRVPEDIAVVGFDDMANATAYYNPPLTTVQQPMIEMGKQAADLLIDLLEENNDKTSFERIILEPKLIVRQSCGAGF